ncbi:transposase [Spirosoma sp. HMF3257]|uniref:Integrase catalytic domain-containing protein n=1 Tax=Spirosoma telluris TaxID=2183553 RepID=A0A327NR86_9BACT|nr:transposase [Spirosoma telluris]RAI77931.1 hypothetical protein HMF3257_34420 [Spirosoma telluris]
MGVAEFNGTFRREVLNANPFSSLAKVRRTVDAWLEEYNAASSGVKVYDPGRIPTGGLNSSQNWLIKGVRILHFKVRKTS